MKPSFNHAKLAHATLLLGAFVGLFSETALNIAIPKLEVAFGVSTATISWLVTGYMLMIGLVMPFNSLISRWLATKKMVQLGFFVFLIGAVISLAAPNFAILLLGRLLQGVGIGILLPLMFTATLVLYAPNQLGKMMGVNSLVVLAAPVLGPTITGFLLEFASWRWLFVIFAVLLLAGLVLATLFVPNMLEVTRPKVDFLSVITSLLGFGSLVVAASLTSELGLSAIVLGLVIFSLVMIGIYSRRQLTLTHPVLNLRIFAISQFRLGAILVMLCFADILAVMYLLPQFQQNALNMSSLASGLFLLPGGLVNLICSLLAGRFFTPARTKPLILAGLAMAFVGNLWLLLPMTHSPLGVALGYVLVMLGLPFVMAPAQTYALASLTSAQASDGSTVMNAFQQIVGAIMTAAITLLLTTGQKLANGSSAARFTVGVNWGIYLMIGILIISAFFASRLPKEKNH